MKHLKGLQRTLMASTAVVASVAVVLAFGALPAKAVTNPTDNPFGSCIGDATHDCVTTNGHISASVVTTLSINEMRAVSFGNFAVTCAGVGACVGGQSLVLDPSGVRAANVGAGADSFVLLNGGGPVLGGRAHDSGSQSPGHYTVSTGAEGATTQVYISFADNAGNIIDACSPGGGGGFNKGGVYGGIYFTSGAGTYTGVPTTCDSYHPGNAVTLTGPAGNTFTVDQFQFNESGSDVYGHYISNQAHVGPGTPTPWLPSGTAGSGHNAGTPAAAADTVGDVDVVVGATLHTVAGGDYAPGKYTSTYEVMVSY
jgi:hypothetical protein